MAGKTLAEVAAELAREFPVEEVGLLIQSTNRERTRALVVPYIDARSVLERLDSVVGPDNWSDSYELLVERSFERDGKVQRLVEVRCRLTVLGITKEDVGEGDTLKGAYSDALKRAAVKFGIGRYLYRSNKVWADLDEYGRIKNEAEVKRQVLGLSGQGNGHRRYEERPSAPVQEEPAPPSAEAQPSERSTAANDAATPKQVVLIKKLLRDLEVREDEVPEYVGVVLGRNEPVPLNALTKRDASVLIDALQQEKKTPF